MREKMTNQADARAVLRFLGRTGYTEVETAGHDDWTAQQFRDMPWLSHPNDPQAEFKTARAGIRYLANVRW